MNTVEKNTPCGKIKGIEKEGIVEFRGIRYATAPGRWEYPETVTSWEGVYDATADRECSYQRRSFEPDEVCNAFYHNEFRRGLSFTYSEDCQHLEIQAPKNAEKAPVIIYIHGGSFTGGSYNESHIDGTELAKNGVIFTAMNYRLGPYGFCSHPDLTDKNGVCGNYGLYDQLCAIEWIKNNISAFGGDPDNITIMGQSAGAMSVDIHLSNPMCKGYFRQCYMMSGTALQRKVLKPYTPEKTRKFWDKICANANCTNMEELKKTDPKTLYYAWFDACKTEKLSMPLTFPVYDGKLLLKDSFKMNNIPDMPYLIGMTTNDMIPGALEFTIRSFAKSALKHNKNGCYLYDFDRPLPGDDKGTWHCSDMLYVFSTLGISWRPFEDIDYKVSKQMSDMLCAFAKTGNPNCDSLPEWESSSKKVMHFCENTQFVPWDTRKLVGNMFSGKGTSL